jgi:hypothetical protein
MTGGREGAGDKFFVMMRSFRSFPSGISYLHCDTQYFVVAIK